MSEQDNHQEGEDQEHRAEPSQEGKQEGAAGERCRDGKQSPPQNQPKWTDKAMVLFSAMLFVATVAYVIVSACQLKATRESVELTRQALNTTERAWVVFYAIGKLKPGPVNWLEDVVFLVHLKNVGRTPARRLTTRAMAQPRGSVPREFLSHRPKGRLDSTTVLGPEMVTRVPAKMGGWKESGLPARPEAIRAFQQAMAEGKVEIYIYGSAKYRDAFNRRHRTLFCMIFNESDPNEFRVCPSYNDAN